MKESVFRLVYICVLVKDTSEKKDNFHDPCISFLLRFHVVYVHTSILPLSLFSLSNSSSHDQCYHITADAGSIRCYSREYSGHRARDSSTGRPVRHPVRSMVETQPTEEGKCGPEAEHSGILKRIHK